MSAEDAAERFGYAPRRPIPRGAAFMEKNHKRRRAAVPSREYAAELEEQWEADEEPAPRRRHARPIEPEEEETTMEHTYYPPRERSSGSPIWGFVFLAIGVCLVALTLDYFGVFGRGGQSTPIMPPTAIIRVIDPYQPAAPLPVRPVATSVPPAQVAPVAAPAVEAAPVAVPPARQVIIIKSSSAPIVIDRGSKRRSP